MNDKKWKIRIAVSELFP